MRITARLVLAASLFVAACSEDPSPVTRAAASIDTIDYRTTKGTAVQVREAARLSATVQDITVTDRLRTMVVLPDGGVAFAEPQARRVVFLNPTAQPLGSFGRDGAAPGEFRQVFAIGMIGDTVWAGDSRQDRVTLIGPDRELLRVVPLPKVKGQDPGNTDIPIKVLLGLQPDEFVGLIPDGEKLFRANLEGQLLNPLPQSPSDARRFQIGTSTSFASLFLPRPKLDVSADGRLIAIYEHVMESSIAPATAVTLVRSTGDTALVRVIRFKGVEFPTRVADSLIAQRTEGRPTEYVKAFRSTVYVPPFYPPVEDVLIGQDDRLWLKLHTPGEQQEYLILSPTGDLVGTVVFPPRTIVRAAKGNIAWVLQLNEFDVADVVKYEISGI